MHKKIMQKNFPNELKLADITPILKKDDSMLAKNYIPVSVLPCVSKIFERIMQKQLFQYVEKFLSPFLCGYRKGFSTQTALLGLAEKWKASLDKKGYCAAVLMDLSKAFDTINHELLLAKLSASGFDKNALEIMRNYLSNRWQRTKINTTFSSWSALLKGVLQGSVLGRILFNIFLNYLFFILKDTDVCNLADDTSRHACDISLDELLIRLEHDSALAVCWFESNYMKLNTDKWHLIISGNKHGSLWADIGKDRIWESNYVKILRKNIDTSLKFEFHMLKVCS